MKIHQCVYCGEELGVVCDSRDRPTCGKSECDRFVRDYDREERENRMERAREDDYSRY